MQMRQPLAIGNVVLSARHILHMLRIDQADLKSSCFENLIHGNPIHTRGLHCYGTNPALFKLIREDVGIPRERWETSHRLWIAVRSDGDVQLACPHINAGRVRMQYRQSVASSLALPGHLFLRGCRSDAWARKQSKLPIEIVVGNQQASSHVCTQPQAHAFRPGFTPSTNVGAAVAAIRGHHQ